MKPTPQALACVTAPEPAAAIEPVFPRRVLACLSGSSRTSAIMAEAWRLARATGATCTFLHAGPAQAATLTDLREAMATAGVPPDLPLLVREGDPAAVVRRVAEEERIDMVVAGILGHSATLSQHFHSIAGRIAVAAPCSVLLLTHPQLHRPPRERFAASVDFDQASLRMLGAVRVWGRREGIRLWHVLHEYDARGFYSPLNASVNETPASRTRRLGALIRRFDWTGMNLKSLCLPNRHGCDALWYAHAARVDVLCTPVTPRRQRFWERMLRFNIDVDLDALPPAILLFRHARDDSTPPNA